jgi:glycosyltransferase involved in cell wall biosynthesis
MAGTWAKRRFKLPLALEINSPLLEERRAHGGVTLQWLARSCERTAWANADLCLPVTNVLAQIVKGAGAPERRIAVMPNGVDPAMFSSAMHGQAVREHYGLGDKIILGFSGFVRPWHGLDRVIRVMAEIAGHADVHLLVVGDGPARPALIALARQLGIEDRMTFTGVVQRIDIAAYMSAFDIALQPDATAYASPLKLIEYMALGKAIVAPDQPNIRELLENERSALLFDKDTPDAIRPALMRLIADRGLRERLGAAAAAEVKRRPLTWTANADHVASLLKRMTTAA